MTIQKYELVSFKLCPFVQRSVITLKEKRVDFKITYIDLANKPDWFLKISPMGKVPVLKVDDTILFESAVINEYLDEVNPPHLHPLDPIRKAHNRAWIEFGSNLLMISHVMSTTKDQEEFEKKRVEFISKLPYLEEQISNGKYFNSDVFSLVDTSYAPLFMRLDLMDKMHKLDLFNDYPKIKNWSNNLLARDSVKDSVVEDFEELYNQFIKKSDGYITK